MRTITLAVPAGAVQVEIDAVTMEVKFVDAKGYEVISGKICQTIGRTPRSFSGQLGTSADGVAPFRCLDYGKANEADYKALWEKYGYGAQYSAYEALSSHDKAMSDGWDVIRRAREARERIQEMLQEPKPGYLIGDVEKVLNQKP